MWIQIHKGPEDRSNLYPDPRHCVRVSAIIGLIVKAGYPAIVKAGYPVIVKARYPVIVKAGYPVKSVANSNSNSNKFIAEQSTHNMDINVNT